MAVLVPRPSPMGCCSEERWEFPVLFEQKWMSDPAGLSLAHSASPSEALSLVAKSRVRSEKLLPQRDSPEWEERGQATRPPGPIRRESFCGPRAVPSGRSPRSAAAHLEDGDRSAGTRRRLHPVTRPVSFGPPAPLHRPTLDSKCERAIAVLRASHRVDRRPSLSVLREASLLSRRRAGSEPRGHQNEDARQSNCSADRDQTPSRRTAR